MKRCLYLPLVFIITAPAHGALSLYGAQTTGSVSTWGLVRFNTPLDGSSVRVGGGGLMFDFDFDAAGVLYSPRGNDLWKVNTTTGAQTLVGDFGITPIITSIAFSSDGVLYGTDNEGTNTSLYTINRQNGLATRVGRVGNYVFGLDFGPDGTLYAASGDIFKIDTETGAQGQVVLPYAGTFITALDFGPDGVLRGTGSSGAGPNSLWAANLGDGVLDLIGPTTEPDLSGLASIPAPGSLAILLTGALGLLRRRR